MRRILVDHARARKSLKRGGPAAGAIRGTRQDCRYLGKNDSFDEAIADFSVAYTDQRERDREVFVSATRYGKLEVLIEGEV